jgi:hypothetical protein
MNKKRIHRWILFSGISVLIVVVFYPVLYSYFVTDDLRLIYISSPLSINSIFEFFTSTGGFFSGFYRPLVRLAFFIDYSIYHLNPTGFHVTNLLFHIANTIMVFYFTRHLTGEEIAGWVAAFIFAVQPLHTEAVSWISGRSDLIFSFFYLLAFLCFLEYKSKEGKIKVYLALSSFFFILSLLSKEAAITLPAILFLTEYFLNHRESRNNRYRIKLWEYIPFVLICVVYLIIKAFFIKGRIHDSELGIEILFRTGYSFFQLFAPINIDTFNLKNMAGFILNSVIIMNLVVLLLAYLYYSRDKKRMIPFLIYCALWVCITSFPLYIVSGARFLYIASVASSMILGLFLTDAIHGLKEKSLGLSRVLLSLLFISIILTSSIRILNRNKLYNYAGNIADRILTQLKNNYPTFPNGSFLYFINFPHDWVRDSELWVMPIPNMGMAIKVKYGDTSLIVHSEHKTLSTTDEKLEFLERNHLKKYIKEGKHFYVFEYQDSHITESTEMFREKIGYGF